METQTWSRIRDLLDADPFPVEEEFLGWIPPLERGKRAERSMRLTRAGELNRRMCTTTHALLQYSLMGSVVKATRSIEGQGSYPVALKMLREICLQKAYDHHDGAWRYQKIPLEEGEPSPTTEDPFIELRVMRYFEGRHHLMPLVDYTIGQDTRYVSMDFKDFGDLLGYLSSYYDRFDRGLPPDLAREIFVQGAAVLWLHSNGVCHRDISLENVLLSDNYEHPTATLHDFGMAACTPVYGVPDGPHHPSLGKPGYRAPEVYNGYFNGIFYDLYSLGVLLYAMVAAAPPKCIPRYAPRMTTETGDLAEPVAQRLRNQGIGPDSQVYELITMLVQWIPTHRVPHRRSLPPSLAILEHPWLKDHHQIPVNEFQQHAGNEARFQAAQPPVY